MKCLCESIHCDHNEPEIRHRDWKACSNEAGNQRVAMLGKVCDSCAAHYRQEGYEVEEQDPNCPCGLPWTNCAGMACLEG